MAQISMEKALDAAQAAVGRLAWEKVILEARIVELEAEVAAAREQPSPPPGTFGGRATTDD
ncbi:hypothetical protein [Streptomyces sp. NPDC006784]|uniref:hypothetical protein n=1 Tax=Streptomyces sp. NPDC006784 TaxID=3364764 RepID=UPI0036CE80D8